MASIENLIVTRTLKRMARLRIWITSDGHNYRLTFLEIQEIRHYDTIDKPNPR